MSAANDAISGETDVSELWAYAFLKRSLFDADGGNFGFDR